MGVSFLPKSRDVSNQVYSNKIKKLAHIVAGKKKIVRALVEIWARKGREMGSVTPVLIESLRHIDGR
jgi:hypothetical protein